MSQQQWFVQFPRGIEGPFTPREIRQLAQAGKLRPDHAVSPDRKSWYRAGLLNGVKFGSESAVRAKPTAVATEPPRSAPPMGAVPPPAEAGTVDDAPFAETAALPTIRPEELAAMLEPVQPPPPPKFAATPGTGLWNETAPVARPNAPRAAARPEVVAEPAVPAESPPAPAGRFADRAAEAFAATSASRTAEAFAATSASRTIDRNDIEELVRRSAVDTPPQGGKAAESPGAGVWNQTAAGPVEGIPGGPVDDLYSTVMPGPGPKPAPPPPPPRRGPLDAVSADIEWMLAHPTEAFHGYELQRVLGRGGMGVVFQARQIKLDRPVAVKCMLLSQVQNRNALARFEKEAKTIAKLRHLNVVQAFDFGQQDERLFLVMELLQGEDLEGILEREKRLAEARVWGLIRQAASGLAHAAELGIVHRDIKPANLFVVDPPAGLTLPAGLKMVKVTDFGIAMLAQEGADSQRLTAENTSMGTPLYMAPEQGLGSELDARADIYALGGTAFHLLAGVPAYDGNNPMHILMKKMKEAPPALCPRFPELHPETDRLLADMLAGDVKRRIPDYAELLSRIDALPCLAGSGLSGIGLSGGGSITVPRGTVTGSATSTAGGGTVQGVFETAPVPGARSWVSSSEALPPGVPAPTRSRRSLLLGGGAALGLATLAGLGALAFLHRKSPPTAPAKLQSNYEQPLFDGVTLTEWSIQRGAWKIGRDEENAYVLEGKAGTIRRRLPPSESYRVVCGVHVRDAKPFELRFAHTKTGGYYAVRLEEGQARLVAVAADGDTPQAFGKPLALPSAEELENSGPYLELRAERQGDWWWAFFLGKALGPLPAQKGRDGDEPAIIFSAEGEVALESIAYYQLDAEPGR